MEVPIVGRSSGGTMGTSVVLGCIIINANGKRQYCHTNQRRYLFVMTYYSSGGGSTLRTNPGVIQNLGKLDISRDVDVGVRAFA